jgi:hypothetical protein
MNRQHLSHTLGITALLVLFLAGVCLSLAGEGVIPEARAAALASLTTPLPSAPLPSPGPSLAGGDREK